MKRLCSPSSEDAVASNTRSKKPRLVEPLQNAIRTYPWVSATQTYNYMRKDSLVDWLSQYSANGYRRNDNRVGREHKNLCGEGFGDFLKNKGNEFEKTVVTYLGGTIPVQSVSEYITDESVQRTIDLMKSGAPVIHSAPFRNIYNKTRGVIDLLVRSDYLHLLVETNPLSDTEQKVKAPLLGSKYHYVVIDIKFSTLPLRADGIHLLNAGSFPAYKVQTCIYNRAIGRIQGYTSRYTFILGRRWRYRKKGITYNNFSSLDKLGVIDFKGVDKPFLDATNKSLSWVRALRNNGEKWSTSPPSRPELYPNMNVDSGKWQKEKEVLAEEIGEITSIWYCGIKHRSNAIKNGITTWKDKNCNSKTLGYGGKRGKVIDKILNINRQNKHKLLPLKLQTDLHSWRQVGNEIFVDFETFADVFAPLNQFPEQKSTDMIFMIGVYYKEGAKWVYKNYIAKDPTREAEYKIMNEFSNFVSDQGNPKIWYWCAEKRFWRTSEQRQYSRIKDKYLRDHISTDWGNKDWSDLCEVFKAEPVVIKDCFKYGLKPIAKAMRKHGMIQACIESECDSGMTAMINAWKCYEKGGDVEDNPIMKDIAKYNEFDCVVLMDIITYLRNNH